jgi:hypothetical protein
MFHHREQYLELEHFLERTRCKSLGVPRRERLRQSYTVMASTQRAWGKPLVSCFCKYAEA